MTSASDIAFASALELAELYRSKTVSPVEAAQALFARLDVLQPKLNAFCLVDRDGALILGKTTTPEFGWKAIGDSPLTGITRNPWNLGHTTGGSSAGAAASCAAGIAPLHVGSDGAGSIRIPSAFTGIFGIKATFGRVPAHPPSPMGLLSNVGPMTRHVRDAAAMLNVLARPDDRDPYALPVDGRDWLAGIEDGVRGWRIAYSADLGYARVDPEIAAAAAAAANQFE